MAFQDGVKSAPIAYIGVVSVIVIFVAVLLLQVMFLDQQQALSQPAAGRPAELANLIAQQQTQLTRRALVDPQRGIVTIGINRAMELVTAELASGRLPAEVMGPPPDAAADAAAAHDAAGERREADPTPTDAAENGGEHDADVTATEADGEE